MSLLFLSFFAGVLSVLAPCVLPVLPVILGSTLGVQKRYRPLIIVGSTVFFISLFTVLLKVSTLFITIPQEFWLILSAVIIILYGLTLVFPQYWEKITMISGINNASMLASQAKKQGGLRGDILLGAALGPIFASCSPTYALLISIVFPQSFWLGVVYTLVYALGFGSLLLVIAYGGRAVIQKLRWAANPSGLFKKILGIILIVTGILIATGYIKKLEVALLDSGFLDVTKIEQKFLDAMHPDKEMKQSQVNISGGIDHQGAAYLNVNYKAPEFDGLENRINTSGWNSVNELSGKVVVIDFWTYSCINCIRTLPYLRKLDNAYRDKGLVIIGVHAPEFQFERVVKNVQKAVKDFGIEYPVVQDNNFKTRRAYQNQYRPAKYIIDRKGQVRYEHFGEGSYAETELVIQALLGENMQPVLGKEKEGTQINGPKTPETYLGTERRERFSQSNTSEDNYRRVEGDRLDTNESIQLQSLSGSISINAVASEVNLVLGVQGKPVNATVFVDGKLEKTFVITEHTLYNLMKDKEYGKHTIEIRFDGLGAEAYAYTFG